MYQLNNLILSNNKNFVNTVDDIIFTNNMNVFDSKRT
jgi:hypothetical protein